MVWQILIKKGIFSKITHKFPIVGQSWMDSDRDGAKIEQVSNEKGSNL